MKHVVMIGPSPSARGGMATVIGTLLTHGYLDDVRSRFIPTHVDGSFVRKAFVAVAALGQFVSLLVVGRIGLLHVHVASGISFWRKAIFIGLAQAFRCPVIFQLHGGEFQNFIEHRLSGWRRRLAISLIQRCDCAFAFTPKMAQWLTASIKVAAVEVFPNPVETDKPEQPRPPTSDVLFMGRIDEKKGVFDLIRSFAWLQARLPDARLILAGDGDVAKARRLASELGVNEAVHFVGWINASERDTWLAKAAVFVLPSHHEQMPISVLEAMAAGTPVVATNVGAVPDMLDNGLCGILVTSNDIEELGTALLTLMTDAHKAFIMSNRARTRVRSVYSVDVVLERLRHRYLETTR